MLNNIIFILALLASMHWVLMVVKFIMEGVSMHLQYIKEDKKLAVNGSYVVILEFLTSILWGLYIIL